MSRIVIASSAQDAKAVEAVKEHHAQLSDALALHVEALIGAAVQTDQPGTAAASKALLQWCADELVPHALAEEASMYPKAHEDSRARLLIDAMIIEHHEIIALIDAIRAASAPVRAAANAQALRILFESHLVKENEQILPLLAASSDVSLTEILNGMHELLGDVAESGCGGDCKCSEENSHSELH